MIFDIYVKMSIKHAFKDYGIFHIFENQLILTNQIHKKLNNSNSS